MSALDAQVGVGVEVTPGTAVTPTRFAEFSSESIESTYARIESKGLRPGRQYRSDSRFTPYFESAAGDLELEVVSKGMGLFFKHMLGAAAAPVGPTDGTYSHVFTPGDLAGDSLTVQVGRPEYDGSSVLPFTYAGGKIATWELSNSNDSNLMLTLGMDFTSETTGTALATASYPTGVETLSWVGGSVSIGGVAFDLTSEVSVSGDNALDTDRRRLRNNTGKLEQIGNGYRSGEFSFTAEFDSLAQRNRVAAATAAGTMAEIVLTWQGKTYAAGTTYPSLTVTINARFDSFAANVSGPEALMQEVGGVYLGTDAIEIAYVTVDSTP